MTDAQHEVLLALNLRQMQMADNAELRETGVFTAEIAAVCGRSARSTAAVLARMRGLRWVTSCHGCEDIGWLLNAAGVAALEAERGVRS